MKSLHQSFQIIGKSRGRSAVAAAAYRSGEKLVEYVLDKETGIITEQIWDYSRKKGVVFSTIYAPEYAPEWVYDRQQLWNRVTAGEMGRIDGQLCREFDIALPVELTPEQNAELLSDIARTYTAYGMVVDVNMHCDNHENPHGHVMLTMRELVKFDNGIVDFGLKNTDWNKVSFLKERREEAAYLINQHLVRHGHKTRVTHLSFKDRGIDLIPTIHLGPAGSRIHGERMKINEEIIQENARRIIANPELVIDRLSIDKPVFSATDIENEIHKALINGQDGKDVEGASYPKEKLLQMYAVVMSSAKLTIINPCDLKGQMLFARSDRVEFEKKLKEVITDLAGQKDHVLGVSWDAVEKINIGVKLTDQQVETVVSILNGSNLSVLEGFPGAGKSTVMLAVRKYYEAAGFEVIGTAMTNKACSELGDKLGIKVVNTTRLRQEWQQQRGHKAKLNLDYNFYKEKEYSDWKGILPAKTVLIADEASSLDGPDICYLLGEINKSGAKAILLGDNNQNPAIGSKGAFLKAGDIAGRRLLTEVNRHKNPDYEVRSLHIEATRALSNYNIAEAISIYEKLGMIKVFDNEAAKQQGVVSGAVNQIIGYSRKYGDLRGLQMVVVPAYTNREVDELNATIRQKLKEAGIVKGGDHVFRSGSSDLVDLSVGDQIIFKSNKSEFDGYGGVDNNEIGIVSRIIEVDEYGHGEFEVKVRDKEGYRLVKIRTDDELYPVRFKHGYALTNYAIQGISSAEVHTTLDKNSGFEAFLVGASRHIMNCTFYVAKDMLEDEVFRTKDMDVKTVREEFQAVAYQMNDGKQQDVPLWQVGLRLLVSKRANLNFANDYRYPLLPETAKTSLSAITQIHQSTEAARIKLANSYQAISEVLEKSRAGIESELLKFFPETEKELTFDAFMIVDSAYRYKRDIAHSSPRDKQIAEDGKRFSAKLREHISSLKLSGVGVPGQDRVDFTDLRKLDQNLILRSMLDKKDLKALTRHVALARKQTDKITLNSLKLKNLEKEIQQPAAECNKLLTGNLGAMREYIECREKVMILQKGINELEATLRKSAFQKMLGQAAKETLNINLSRVSINVGTIVRANRIFAGKYFNEHQKEIESLKAENKELKETLKESGNKDRNASLKIIKENNKRLKEIFNVRGVRGKHLLEVIGDCAAEGKELDKDQKNLLIAHLMDNGKEGCRLNTAYLDCVALMEDLNTARLNRAEKALLIVDNYEGHVDNQLDQVKMGKLITQMGFSFETIRKHAGLEEVKHYFESLRSDKQTISHHPSFSRFMDILAEGAGVIELEGKELMKLAEVHEELARFMGETRKQINHREEEREQLKFQEQQEKFFLEDFHNFRQERLPNYFDKVFKDRGETVMEKLVELWEKTTDKSEFVEFIEENPQMLGRVKSTGFWARLIDSETAEAVNLNLQGFKDNIKQFVNGNEMVVKIKSRPESEQLIPQIQALTKEIEMLKARLASKEEQKLLDVIGHLKEYEGFERIGAGKAVADLCKSEDVSELVIQFRGQEQKTEQVRVDKELIPDQPSIEENKAAEAQKEKAVNPEELKKSEADINTDTNNKPNKKQVAIKEARLDFEDVKRAINPGLVESIFRQYGQVLNPDGKMEKKGNQLFCGSLNINLRDGRWYRFSDGSKGDIFALVKEAAGVDTKGAFEIVAGHAGIGPKTSVGLSLFKNQDLTALEKANPQTLQKEETWRVLDKIPENAPAFNPKKDLSETLKKNNWRLSATYEYRSTDGELLGYVVRVLDEEGKKQTLPVSYCHNAKANINRWWLKGFSDNGYKPIYGAEKLGQSPLQRVLIVEGEKAADAAAKIFPEHTVISWMGGSAAASKANWKAVGGREVTVWPDNDGAGEKAAKAIITEINKVNGFKGAVNIVDTQALNLPEKWDLADELPAHLTQKDLVAAISNAKVPETGNRLDMELANQVRAVLCNKEFGDYINYGVKRGKLDPGHDYLDLKDALYREMLTVSVVSFMHENSNTKEALKMNEMLEAPVKNIPELAGNILQVYESSRNSKTINDFGTGKQINSSSKELTELNPAKGKLHDELMQDFVWLHQKQAGQESLNKVHQDKISHDLAAIIKGYNLSYKGSEKAMSDSDRKIIADNAYKLINSKEWQEEVKKAELARKEEVTRKTTEKLIGNVISKNLTQLDKANGREELKTGVSDFKGNKYTNRIDYLVALVEDKEITAHLKFSPLQKEIQEAVRQKHLAFKEQEKAKNRKAYDLLESNYGNNIRAIKAVATEYDFYRLNERLKGYKEDQAREVLKNEVAGLYKGAITPDLESIYQKYTGFHPKNLGLFRNELSMLERLNPEKLPEVVEVCKTKGINSAIKSVVTENERAVTSKTLAALGEFEKSNNKPVKKVFDVFGTEIRSADQVLKNLAQDKDVLKYLDKSFEYPDLVKKITGKEVEGIKPEDFSDKHTIRKIIKDNEKDHPEKTMLFKREMDSLDHFAFFKVNTVLRNYEEKNLDTLISDANREVTKAINNTIQRELECLRPNNGKQVKAHDFARNSFDNKTDYLISIGNDKRLTNYLAPSIKKEICAAQEERKLEQQAQKQLAQQNQKNKGFDFEREL